MVEEGEYKDYFIQRLRTFIVELKMSNKDNKLKIQKLQQDLDKVTNDI